MSEPMDLHDALTVARAALAGRNGPDDRRAHETICTFVQLKEIAR